MLKLCPTEPRVSLETGYIGENGRRDFKTVFNYATSTLITTKRTRKKKQISFPSEAIVAQLFALSLSCKHSYGVHFPSPPGLAGSVDDGRTEEGSCATVTSCGARTAAPPPSVTCDPSKVQHDDVHRTRFASVSQLWVVSLDILYEVIMDYV